MYTNITLLLTWRLQSWHTQLHGKRSPSQFVTNCSIGASLLDFPLSWRRNTQIQMYWLWKWLESYNNCTFSTWKDTFLFNLLFWIPNSFCTFHDYDRGGTAFLASPDGPSLIFYYSEFWTTFLPWKTKLPWNFSPCWNIFYLSGLLSNLCLPWKTECPLNSLYWIYIFNHSEFWATFACPEKTEFILKIFTALKYFLSFRISEELCACPDNRVCHEIFDCI